MPTNLTDVSSFDTVTGPIGTDIRNAASVRSALQTLANRTRYLFDRSEPLADYAALKAIASPVDKLVRLVRGKGLYIFDTASAASELLPLVVAPNAGSGRWIRHDGTAQPVVPGSSGFPIFETSRSHTRFIHPVPFSLTLGWQWGVLIGHTLFGPATTQTIIIPFDPHNGATLASVDAYIQVANHTNVPAVLPSIDVLRSDIALAAAPTSVSLRLTGAVAFATPASGAAWTAGNNVQKWTFTCDQNQVIDRAAYRYHIVLVDESGVNSIANNKFNGFTLNYTAIADMRFA